MNEEKVKFYNCMIEDLDKSHATTLESQELAAGNKATIYEQISKRMAANNEYRIKRENLVKLKDEAEGVSPAIAAFLKPEIIESKFGLDDGTIELDNSLQPLGGRSLGKKI